MKAAFRVCSKMQDDPEPASRWPKAFLSEGTGVVREKGLCTTQARGVHVCISFLSIFGLQLSILM